MNHDNKPADEAEPLSDARLLARAVGIAARVHETQIDKAGEAYVLHPLRLLLRAQPWGTHAQIVAVLHDVLEDAEPPGSWNGERLQNEGFPPVVVDALQLVTRKREKTHGVDETYNEFVQRILDAGGDAGKIARRVKLLDLEDNMTMTRLKADLTDKDVARLREYHAAYKCVEEALHRDV